MLAQAPRATEARSVLTETEGRMRGKRGLIVRMAENRSSSSSIAMAARAQGVAAARGLPALRP
jgi:hypothetical protein